MSLLVLSVPIQLNSIFSVVLANTNENFNSIIYNIVKERRRGDFLLKWLRNYPIEGRFETIDGMVCFVG